MSTKTSSFRTLKLDRKKYVKMTSILRPWKLYIDLYVDFSSIEIRSNNERRIDVIHRNYIDKVRVNSRKFIGFLCLFFRCNINIKLITIQLVMSFGSYHSKLLVMFSITYFFSFSFFCVCQ